jgi:hypothetical protein
MHTRSTSNYSTTTFTFRNKLLVPNGGQSGKNILFKLYQKPSQYTWLKEQTMNPYLRPKIIIAALEPAHPQQTIPQGKKKHALHTPRRPTLSPRLIHIMNNIIHPLPIRRRQPSRPLQPRIAELESPSLKLSPNNSHQHTFQNSKQRKERKYTHSQVNQSHSAQARSSSYTRTTSSCCP